MDFQMYLHQKTMRLVFCTIFLFLIFTVEAQYPSDSVIKKNTADYLLKVKKVQKEKSLRFKIPAAVKRSGVKRVTIVFLAKIKTDGEVEILGIKKSNVSDWDELMLESIQRTFSQEQIKLTDPPPQEKLFYLPLTFLVN